MLSKSLLYAAFLPVLSLAKALPAKTLDQLSLGTWFENIAVRPNGDLLLTQMWPSAIIYTIRNPSGQRHALEELVTIPQIQSLYGIAQVPKDHHGQETFVFVGSNSSSVGNPTLGTYGAWAIDFEGREHNDKAKLRKIADLKTSELLNGLAAIPGFSSAVLISDSARGTVGRLDLSSGAFDASAFSFPEMVQPPDATLPIGVNGIKIYNDHLYWTNSYEASIYRIAIIPAGYPAKGAKPELVANLSNSAAFLDDFTFDDEGNIWAATNLDNKVIYLNASTGKAKVVVGGVDLMTVAGDTSVAFGRGKHDKDILYVATSGAIADPVEGNKTEGAKVVAIDTRAY